MSGIIARGQITIAAIDGARYVAVVGTAHDAGTSSVQLPRSVKADGQELVSHTQTRGVVVVTIDRTTLAVVAEHAYDTYGDVIGSTVLYEGGCAAMTTFLSTLDSSVFVAIASFDACGWTQALVDKLKEFGLGVLPYSDNAQARTPFAFLGYKGLSEGYALMQQHAPAAYTHTAKVGAYIIDGTFVSTRDGKDGADGRSLTEATEHYFASQYGAGDSHAPVTPTDGSDWGTDPNAQGWNENAKYLWNYERKTYANSDGSVTIARTAAHVVAIWTKGISSITNYYQRTNSTTTPSVTAYGQSGSPGSAWKTTVQPANGSNRYQWNFERVVYTDGTATDTTPHILERYVVDGKSPFFGDLDNEMDSVACNSDGKPTPSGQQIETTAVIHHGADVYSQGFDTLSVYSDASCASEYSYNTFVNGVKVVRDTTTGKVSITFSNGAVLTKKTFFIKFQYGDSPEFVRSLTVNGVRPGANGDPAAVYQLVPSAKQVAHRKDGSYDNGTLTCAYTKNVGGTFVTPTGATVKVKLDGATEADYSTGGYDAGDDFDTQIEFLLYVDGEIVDRETIPVVEDGTDGDNAETFSIETSESEAHYDGGGVLTTGFIDVRGYRCVGQGERTLVAGNAAMAVAGPHYYCAYSVDGGSTWTACAKKNMAHAWLGVPVAAVEQVTSADKLRIRMQYATSATKNVSTDMVVMERDPLPVHYDGTNGGNGKDAAAVQPNLLRQTLFEGKDDLWVRQFGTKTLVAGTDGRGAMQVSPTGATTTWGNTYQNVADVLEAGTEYTISFYAKSSAPFYLYIDGLNSSGGNAVWFDNSVTPTGNGGTIAKSTTYAYESMLIPTTATWKRYEMHVKTAASLSGVAVVRLSFRTYKAGQTVGGVTLTADGTATICMPKLERGAAATAYMPHETEMQGEDGYSITLSPSAVIIEQATEQNQQGIYPLDLSKAYAILRVTKGGVPVGATVTAVNDGRCTHVLTQEGTGLWSIGITAVGVDADTWYADTDGVEVNSFYREGRITLNVTPQGETQTTTLYFDFHCNLLGAFTRQIKGDVETSIATKITSSIQDGSVTTLEEVGTYIRSASQNVSTLQQAVGQHTTAISEIRQTVDRIDAAVYEVSGFNVDNYGDGPFWANGNTTSIDVLAEDVIGGGKLTLNIDLQFEEVEDELSSKRITLYLRRYGTSTSYTTQTLGVITKDDFEDGYAWKQYVVAIPERTAGNYVKIVLVATSTFSGDCEIEYDAQYRLSTGVGLVRTGIDIENRKITAQADNFEIWNNAKTKKTFSIDQDGNLMSAGDAYIGGTIRADNFFHKITQYTATNTSKPYTYFRCYVPQNYSIAWDNKTAEGTANAPYRGREGQYVDDAPFNADCLVPCTHNADIVISTTYNTGYVSGQGYDIYIPKAGDFEGKVIEVYNLCTNTTCVMHIMEVPDFDASGNLVNSTPFKTGWSNGGWNNYTQNFVPIKGCQKVVLYSDGSKWIRLGAFTILT